MKNPHPRQFFQASAATLVIASSIAGILLSTAAPASAADCQLVVSPAAVTAGNEVDVDIALSSSTSPSAIAFTIEYDTSKLSLLAPTGSTSTAPVTVLTPSTYESAVFTGLSAGQIGIAVFPDPYSKESIVDGPIVRLRLLAARDAVGLAFVRIASTPPPSASGDVQQLLSVDPGSPDSGVAVTPLVPLLAVSPASLDFGAVQQGSSVRRQVVIADDGNAPASISGISIAGDNSFSIASAPPTPSLLNADDNVEVTVQFNASGESAYRATLQIATASGQLILVPILASSSVDPSSIYGTKRLVPAVAKLTESDGSSWVSELTAFNSSDFEAGMRLIYRPSDGSPDIVDELTLPANGSQQFSDVLGQFFGVPSGSGIVIAETSTPEITLRSTTFHRLPAGGSLPETVPPVAWASLIHTGEEAILPMLDFSGQSRTNVAIMNLSTGAAAFQAQLIRQDGTVAATSQISLAPQEIAGKVDLFEEASLPDSALTVVISPTTSDALFFAYASTVDVRSGAPLYLPAR